MSKSTAQRRRYIVDPKLQYRVAFQILGALLGVAALWIVGMMVLAGPESVSQLEPLEVRQLLFRVNAIYFGLGATIVVVLTLLLTHRVAGPAFVIGRALRTMQDGEYDVRLSLRDNDFLTSLAGDVNKLAQRLGEQHTKRDELLADLERCIIEGDTNAARELLAQLRSAAVSDDGPQSAAPAAESPAPAAHA